MLDSIQMTSSSIGSRGLTAAWEVGGSEILRGCGWSMVTPLTEPQLLPAGPASARRPLGHLCSQGVAFASCAPGESRNGDPGEREGRQLVPDVHDLQGPVHAPGQRAVPSAARLQRHRGDRPRPR